MAKVRFEVKPHSGERRELDKAITDADKRSLADPFELFAEMITAVREQESHRELILFIDEFDRLPNKDGMGDFIKHCGDARAVILGVSETAPQLIGHHPSADRKLFASQIVVPPLSRDEVDGIFSNAADVVRKSGGYESISYSREFLDAAYKACGGYPAIAQFIGFEAFRQSEVLERARRQSIIVGLSDFERARLAVMRGGSQLSAEIRDAVGQSKKKATILDHLSSLDSANWVDQSIFRDGLPDTAQDAFARSLDDLVKSAVIVRSGNRIKFTTPVYRLFVILAKEGSVLYPA